MHLLTLLEAETDPAPALYKRIIDRVLEDPDEVRHLTDDDVQEHVILHLTTCSDRLMRVFNGLRQFPGANHRSQTTSNLAAATADFLVQMLPALQEILLPAKVISFVIPALELCLQQFQPPPMRKLAFVLADCGRLLEHLASDLSGSQIMRQWASILGTSISNAPILELWTERLVSMVKSCKVGHDVAQAIQQCHTLSILKSRLRSLEARHSEGFFGTDTRPGPLPLSSMTRLSKEDKKTRPTERTDPNTNTPVLDNEIKDHLEAFDMLEPKTWSAVGNVIARLEGEETLKVLLLIAAHFPCELCIQAFEHAHQRSDARATDGNFGAIPNLKLEILGKSVGVWQVLLSAQALKSLQEMSRQGTLPLSTTCAVVADVR